VLGLVIGARAAAPAGSASGDCTPSPSWGTLASADVEAEVVQLVNAHRAALGLRPLVQAKALAASAEWKSMNMAGYGYMEHDDPAPVARTLTERFAACGYPTSSGGWGENIAYGYPDPRAVMTAWLNDPPHKANIEDPSWTTIGVGAARSSAGVVYWTQDFGTTGASAPTPAPPPATAPAPQPAPAPASPLTPSVAPQPTTTPAAQPVAASGEADTTGPDANELPEVYAAAPGEHSEGDHATGPAGAISEELANDPLSRDRLAEQRSPELPREDLRRGPARRG
jgi:uncharacterized protein YkwD